VLHRLSLFGFFILAACTCGCASGRRSEPLHGPVELRTEQERRGEWVFFHFCHQCHPAGDAGLGPAINNKPLPGAAIRLQIRQGVGAMPSFSDSEINDRDVDAVIAYLSALKNNG
jgi:mono/diheme cytochrome c family protein